MHTRIEKFVTRRPRKMNLSLFRQILGEYYCRIFVDFDLFLDGKNIVFLESNLMITIFKKMCSKTL
jgi:hypothetical protein